ncbi:dihydrolipoyl dehydrogenase [[Mycoplasma] collis]|uniref:dihydrolipoyl dehydrogenase n=1 Tax=[Mycoplasma] collis TaxID=2127 RepID=UPI00051C6078|nr:dihydrolipoyl dehydrogenase [[Mycoplasma] collis]
MEKYDVVILGAGPGGYTLANILAVNGKKVLIIEKDKLGGTCVNYGCIPTKTLLNKMSFLNELKKEQLINKNEIEGFYAKLKKQMRQNSQILQNNIKNLLNNSNIKVLNGYGEVLDSNTISVNNQKIIFDKLIIATGSYSRELNIENSNLMKSKKILLTSNDILKLKTIPKSITIIGAGAISLEFAYFFNSLNTRVTILEAGRNIFANFSPDIANYLKKWLIQNKINFYDNVKLEKFENNNLIFKINDEIKKIKTEKYFAAIGRIPNLNGLEKLKLELNVNNSIKVDAKMKTSINNIYAIGDVNGLSGLTSGAYKQGDIVAKELLNFEKNEEFNSLFVPSTIYINPEISFIGMSENYLQKNNIEYIKLQIPSNKLPRTYIEKSSLESFMEIYIDKNNFKILGSTIILKNSSLLINIITQFIKDNKTIYDLQEIAYTHPTFAEAFYYLARNFIFRKK